MTESEVFEAVTGSGTSDFAIVVRILNEHGPWCLIGGLAVNCYVEPVFTVDVEIVVVSSQLVRIREELIAAGLQVSDFPHSLNALMPGSKLRIQLTLDPRHQDFLKDTKLITVLDELVPVASLENIARGKIWAWGDQKRRPTKLKKDELDLMRLLEAYPELRGMMPDEIKRQLP